MSFFASVMDGVAGRLFWLIVKIAAVVAVVAFVAGGVGYWLVLESDCPEPVVDTEYYDSIVGPYVALAIEVRDSVWWDLIERVDFPCADSISKLNELVEKQQATLNHWDTVGSPAFRYMERKLYSGIIAAVDSLFDANSQLYHQFDGRIIWVAGITSLDYKKFKQARGL